MDTPIRVPTLAEFIACCHAAFEFLVREYGFVLLASPREHNIYSVCFRKGEFGVDVYGETHGETATCDLVRGGDRLPLGLLVPVVERKPHERRRARPGQLAQVHDIATRLKLRASDFLRADSSRFDAALAEWKRVTQPRPVTEAQRIEQQRQQAVTAAGHASKRADYAEVVRLLQPYADALSPHQRRMLEMARNRLGKGAD
jgi:hypothetical protein